MNFRKMFSRIMFVETNKFLIVFRRKNVQFNLNEWHNSGILTEQIVC